MASIRGQGSWAFAAEGTPAVAAGAPLPFEGPFVGGTWVAFLGAANVGILAEGEWVDRGLLVAFPASSSDLEDLEGAEGDPVEVRAPFAAVAPVAVAAAAVGT